MSVCVRRTDHDELPWEHYRYGKKQLETMAVNLASEEYLKDNARHCPHCNAPIEKNEGCNKVSEGEHHHSVGNQTITQITCWRCGTNFCWLCGAQLPRQNPYSHFNFVGGETVMQSCFFLSFALIPVWFIMFGIFFSC